VSAVLFDYYKLTPSQRNGVIVDSDMSYDEAIADHKVPREFRAQHKLIRPFLRVVPVIYYGYDDKIHQGQIVVHTYIEEGVRRLFKKLFEEKFPIFSVIPASHFGYDDERSMAANNSSAYRPGDQEHGYAAAIDLNPFTNPFDRMVDGVRTIEPKGAHYNPHAKGAITHRGVVATFWTSLGGECGCNWGDETAGDQFYVKGFFDYQHLQLGGKRHERFHAQILPAALRG